MVDCDPQRTTSDWIQARNGDPTLPAINCIQLYGKDYETTFTKLEPALRLRDC